MPTYIPGVTFVDVPAGHWCEPEIKFGYEHGEVMPDGTVRRFIRGYEEPAGSGIFYLHGTPADPAQKVLGNPDRFEMIAFVMRPLMALQKGAALITHDPPVTLPDDPAFPVSAEAHNASHKFELPLLP